MIRLLTLVAAVIWTAVLVIASAGDARAERRVALVVGNSNYKTANISLVNPKNDAQDISSTLKDLGFDVITTVDATKRDMDLALQNFARKATDADSALFFYAGHAMQFQGRNYLMPTDAELEDEISVRYQMVAMDEVRAALDRANGVKIMILDACRNNPLADRLQKSIVGASRSIATVRGLARIDKTQGMVVAYATAADDVAQDGQGRNSPFTAALLKRLREPGLEIEMMFRRVAYDVNVQTGGRQRPETTISLLSEYYLNQSDRIVWDRIKDQDDVNALRDFVGKFPSSPLAIYARNRLDLLERYAREREDEAARRAREDEQRRIAEAAAQRVAQEAAARRREEEDRRAKAEAEQRQRVEQQAALQRQEDERRAKAEADRKAAEQALQQAALKRQDDERRAKAEADRKAAEQALQQAALKRQEDDRRATAEADRKAAEQAASQQAALKRQEDDRRAKAEADRKAAEQAALQQAALKRQEDERRAKAEADRKAAEQAALQQAALKRQEDERRQRLAALEQPKPEQPMPSAPQAQIDPEVARIEETCRREEEHFRQLQAAGASARAELVKFETAVTCKLLRPQVTTAIAALPPAGPPVTSPPPPVAVEPPQRQINTAEQVRTAQEELKRVGCFIGKPNGILNESTEEAVKTYWTHTHQAIVKIDITDEFISDVKEHDGRVCKPARVRPESEPVAKRPPSRPSSTAAREPARPEPPRPLPAPTAKATASSGQSHSITGVGF